MSALQVTTSAWHCERRVERNESSATVDIDGCKANKKSSPSRRMVGFAPSRRVGDEVEGGWLRSVGVDVDAVVVLVDVDVDTALNAASRAS